MHDDTTVPSAAQHQENNKISQQNRFAFYNYSGIHRKVQLYTTASTYLQHLAVNDSVDGIKTIITPELKIVGDYDYVKLIILDEQDHIVDSQHLGSDLVIASTRRWQPFNAYL